MPLRLVSLHLRLAVERHVAFVALDATLGGVHVEHVCLQVPGERRYIMFPCGMERHNKSMYCIVLITSLSYDFLKVFPHSVQGTMKSEGVSPLTPWRSFICFSILFLFVAW